MNPLGNRENRDLYGPIFPLAAATYINFDEAIDRGPVGARRC
jgi:hypothetical protein